MGPAACAAPEPVAPPLTAVRAEVVRAAGVPGALRYSAAILPANRVDVAFRVPGYIAAIEQVSEGSGSRLLQEGDRVGRGQVLATLRADDFDAKIAQARSQQAEAEAALAQAKQAFDRTSGLYERKSVTRPEYEAARAAHESLVAKQAGARALVAEAENVRADLSLRSPLTGVVLRRTIEVGSFVGPGAPAFVIADTASVKIPFGVPESVIRRLSVRQAIAVTTSAYPNDRFDGRITNLATVAAPGSLVFDVEVTVPNGDRRLKPGMVASIELPGEAVSGRLAVPLAAVIRSRSNPEGYALFVVEERENRSYVRAREVTLGEMVANGVVVTGGLRDGERIVVSGATIITDGEAVELVR
jgi:multidrug efflux system membrane fusion protein